jgi:hypothetical protein
MHTLVSRILLSFMTAAAALSKEGFAQNANLTEDEANMFAVNAGYERFMGRWSRRGMSPG